jgi:hypothetical protein
MFGDDDRAAGFDLADALTQGRFQLPDADSFLPHGLEATLYQVWPRGRSIDARLLSVFVRGVEARDLAGYLRKASRTDVLSSGILLVASSGLHQHVIARFGSKLSQLQPKLSRLHESLKQPSTFPPVVRLAQFSRPRSMKGHDDPYVEPQAADVAV